MQNSPIRRYAVDGLMHLVRAVTVSPSFKWPQYVNYVSGFNSIKVQIIER